MALFYISPFSLTLHTYVCDKPLDYEAELYPEEHKQKFTIGKADFKMVKYPEDKARLLLTIDWKPIAKWFRE